MAVAACGQVVVACGASVARSGGSDKLAAAEWLARERIRCGQAEAAKGDSFSASGTGSTRVTIPGGALWEICEKTEVR